MMNNMNPLSQLRQIHLPAAISKWPQTIGWYIIIALIIVAIITALIKATKWWLTYQRRQKAMRRLKNLTLN